MKIIVEKRADIIYYYLINDIFNKMKALRNGSIAIKG